MVRPERLRHLAPSEIPFRIREQLVLRTDRFRALAPSPAGPPPRWPAPARPLPGADEPAPADPYDWDCGWPDLPSRRLDLLGSRLDPRLGWEKTRLQHLALAAARGDPRAAAQARAYVEDRPPGRGLGWATALEVALRLVSLVRLAALQPQSWQRAAIYDHAVWIARHPSRGTSAGNHRVAELAALALAGRSLGCPRWASQVAELPGVLLAQLHADGAGVEQSPSYLAFDLECALLARLCGVELLEEPLRRGARFLRALCSPHGCVPRLGDDDGGRLLALSLVHEPDYVRSVTGAACLLLSEPVPPGYHPDDRAQMLGVQGEPVPWAPRSTTFLQGGLTVLVSGALQVVVDHGPLGGCTLAAHGHADALSVWIDHGGPVITGRGTGQYNADPLGRRFHRGTGAHPTVVVDGRDQSQPHEHAFLWRSRAETALEHVDLGAGQVRARCRHAGTGVVHRRTVQLQGQRVLLEDEVVGSGRHHLAVLLPLAPELEVDGSLRLLRAGRAIGRVHPDPRCHVRVIRGGERPGLGWHSPRYGEWVPACALSCEVHARAPALLRTTLEFG
jgi:hypothetical protein